ncbi:TIGR02679 domain-containing protein [Dactylosporangium sp. CA-139066]|uniref:TIGR02679 domain-containing protein n=1 Tax=Dactylosporangium sp. CA-139066 TaxID=3239930 RepID=UPI003D94FA85
MHPHSPTTDPAADPGWRRLLDAARRSLERTGGRLDGSVSIAAPTDDERLVVIGITGVYRPIGVSRLTVRLDAVEAHLRATRGVGLTDVLGPLRDRPGERQRAAVERDALLTVAAGSRHASSPWYQEWVDGIRRDGTLTRISRSGVDFHALIAVLDALPAAEEPMPAFAERLLGDTKALADGPLRGLTLRALAAWHQVPVPAGAEQERALWDLAGVVLDDLASQVLVLNVPATGGLLGSWLTDSAAARVPVRVTLHQLRLAPTTLTCAEVFVCENPAVLRAAVAGTSRPLICTEGVPSAAVHALLRSAGPDTVIRWRNDLDWTGVRLTGAALARYPNAVPWRMDTATYLPHGASGVPLLGTPAATPWEPALAETMTRTGRAVMEERILPLLLRDLC